MKVLLRADASTAVGTGHAMRCLALGQALRDTGADVVLASVQLPAAIGARFQAEGIACRALSASVGGSAPDGTALRELARAISPDWIVFDGYGFTAEYLAAVDGRWRRLLLDDLGGEVPPVDCVVNGNAYASAPLYHGGATDCELLLGPRYAPLRREFVTVPARAPAGALRQVIVSLGGADPANVTQRVMQALVGLDAEVRVVVGAGHPDPDGVRAAAARNGQEVLVDVRAMSVLLAGADLVVGAGGTSALEYARCGVPAVLLVLADNQSRVVPALAAAGVAVDAGRPGSGLEQRLRSIVDGLAADASGRAAMTERGQRLVDGRGALRVARAMALPAVRLRPATATDEARLLAWANDPGTRAASFGWASITAGDHAAWFASRLADPDVRIWIAEADGAPIGVARFESSGGRAVVSVSLAAERRGQGLGSRVIGLASRRLLDELPVDGIDAWMWSGNDASAGAFRAAGYAPRSGERPAGVPEDARLLSMERREGA